MAAPAIKNSGAAYTSNSVDSANSITLTKPTGANAPAVGDLLIILVANDDNSNAQQWSNSDPFKPSGFTFISEIGNAVSDCHIGAFWRIADGTEGATVGIQSGDTANQVGYYIVIEGAAGSTPIDASGGSVETSGSSITPGAITTTVADCLAIAWQAGDGGDLTPVSVTGTGWGKIDDVENGTGGTDVSACWATKEVASAGSTGSPTFDFDGSLSDGCCAYIFAIAPGVAANTAVQTFPAFEQAASGAEVLEGQGAQTFGAFEQAASGAEVLEGQGAQTFGAFEQAASGAEILDGQGAQAFNAFEQAASGAVVGSGNAAAQIFAAFAQEGSGAELIQGAAAQVYGAFVQAASGGITAPPAGDGAQAFPAFEQAGAAGLTLVGGAALIFPAFTQQGTQLPVLRPGGVATYSGGPGAKALTGGAKATASSSGPATS